MPTIRNVVRPVIQMTLQNSHLLDVAFVQQTLERYSRAGAPPVKFMLHYMQPEDVEAEWALQIQKHLKRNTELLSYKRLYAPLTYSLQH